MISVIVRTKNEERWIGECLRRIRSQVISEPVEIILVDNCSTDATVEKARTIFPEIIVQTITDYLPGRAINVGVEASKGDFFAVISAHCLPTDNYWLANLRKNLDDPNVAGVYGRQIPMNYTEPVDKRDLLVTFGLDRIIQTKGTFFHNANSMVRRSVWEQIPFENEITNIEDRIWGKKIISTGYTIIYEPEACVFHYHGIHQKNNYERLTNVVRIFEEYKIHDNEEITFPIDPKENEVLAVIPYRKGDIQSDSVKYRLFDHAYSDIKEASLINSVVLFSDDEDLLQYASKYEDVITDITREQELSKERLATVFKVLLAKLQQRDYYPDIVIPIELIYPFRPKGMFDKLIQKLLYGGFDTVVPGYKEYRACWKKNNGSYIRLDNHELKREEREPIQVGVLGLGFATYPELLRQGIKYGKKIGIVDYQDPLIKMELRSPEQMKYLNALLFQSLSENLS